MSRNFGAGSRDMAWAGRTFAEQAYQSYASVATVSNRFADFADFAKSEGVKKLEDVTRDTVTAYAQSLQERGLAPATAQNYLSAVNRIMETARGDQDVRVTGKEAGLESRSGVASNYKGGAEIEGASDKAQAIYGLAQTLGLRFEEASKLDLDKAIAQADQRGEIRVDLGTKGGQARDVPVSEQAREALATAKEVAGESRNLIGSDTSYKSHQDAMYKENVSFHAGRHEYANERYSELMAQRGIETQSPVLSDKPADQAWSQYLSEKAGISPQDARDIDREVRLELSEELGHHREDVVSAYIGGQS